MDGCSNGSGNLGQEEEGGEGGREKEGMKEV